MADPLSIGASVVSILSVAGHVSKKLFDFIQNTREAPDQAYETLREVNDLRLILGQCQTLLSRNEQSQVPGASYLLVEDVATVIMGCVLSFSKLERLLTEVETENGLNIIDRMKWAWREKKLAKITGRLISQKQSLSLMVTILGWYVRILCQWDSIRISVVAENGTLSTYQADALQPVSELRSMIQTILVNQNGLSERIRTFESIYSHESQDMPTDHENDKPSFTLLQNDETREKEYRAEREQHNAVSIEDTAGPVKAQTAYIEELQASKVYRRIPGQSSGVTTMSFITRPTLWSELSGYSLADVSAISDIMLPIDRSDFRGIEVQRTKASINKMDTRAEETKPLTNLPQQPKQRMLKCISNIVDALDYDYIYNEECFNEKVRIVQHLRALLETGSGTFEVKHLLDEVFTDTSTSNVFWRKSSPDTSTYFR